MARRHDCLERLAGRLRERDGTMVQVLPADLTDADDLQALEHWLAEKAPDVLVNNARIAGYEPFASTEPDAAEAMIRLKVVASTRLARAVLPAMISRGQGTIINVASLMAWSPRPNNAIYVAANSFLVTFTEFLGVELDGTGVTVQALCPGPVGGTEFFDVSHYDTSTIPASLMMTPADVVDASFAALRSGELICVPALEDPR